MSSRVRVFIDGNWKALFRYAVGSKIVCINNNNDILICDLRVGYTSNDRWKKNNKYTPIYEWKNVCNPCDFIVKRFFILFFLSRFSDQRAIIYYIHNIYTAQISKYLQQLVFYMYYIIRKSIYFCWTFNLYIIFYGRATSNNGQKILLLILNIYIELYCGQLIDIYVLSIYRLSQTSPCPLQNIPSYTIIIIILSNVHRDALQW